MGLQILTGQFSEFVLVVFSQDRVGDLIVGSCGSDETAHLMDCIYIGSLQGPQ